MEYKKGWFITAQHLRIRNPKNTKYDQELITIALRQGCNDVILKMTACVLYVWNETFD